MKKSELKKLVREEIRLLRETAKFEGFPEVFWVVTKPNKDSEIGDILGKNTIWSFVLQVKDGLRASEVYGFYINESKAKSDAEKLLKSVQK